MPNMLMPMMHPFGLPGSNPQQSHASEISSDQSMNDYLDAPSFSITTGAWLLLPSFHHLFLRQPSKTKIKEKLEHIVQCNSVQLRVFHELRLKMSVQLFLQCLTWDRVPVVLCPCNHSSSWQHQHGSQVGGRGHTLQIAMAMEQSGLIHPVPTFQKKIKNKKLIWGGLIQNSWTGSDFAIPNIETSI